MTQDEEHVRILSIFHYVVGGLAALFAMIPLIHMTLGIFLINMPEKLQGKGEPVPEIFGWILVILASIFIAAGLTFAGFVVAAGRSLARRRNYTFCLVMGGVECIFMPFGTVLGIFTIIVLMRESVKKLFAGTQGAQSASVIRS